MYSCRLLFRRKNRFAFTWTAPNVLFIPMYKIHSSLIHIQIHYYLKSSVKSMKWKKTTVRPAKCANEHTMVRRTFNNYKDKRAWLKMFSIFSPLLVFLVIVGELQNFLYSMKDGWCTIEDNSPGAVRGQVSNFICATNIDHPAISSSFTHLFNFTSLLGNKSTRRFLLWLVFFFKLIHLFSHFFPDTSWLNAKPY